MKIFVMVLNLMFLSGCMSVSSHTLELLDKPAQPSKLFLEDGTYSTTEAYKGEELVLLFWTSICHHSENAVIDFNDFAKNFKGHSRTTFLAINIDKFENLDAVREYIQKERLTHLTHAYSGNDLYDEAFQNFRGDLVPYYVVIDKHGIVKVLSARMGDVEEYLAERGT